MTGRPTHSRGAIEKIRSVLKKADLLVYTESQRSSHSPCSDELFWQVIFKKFFPRKKISFQPIGGKSQLNKLMQEIFLNGPLDGVYIARDRDHDHILFKKKKLKANNIILTCGYSWENDVLICKNCLLQCFKNLGVTAGPVLSEIVNNLYDEIREKLSKATLIDFVLYHKESSLFSRDGSHSGILDGDFNSGFKISRQRLSNLYRQGKAKAISVPSKKFPNKISAVRDCYGKLIYSVVYHNVLSIFQRQMGIKLNISKEAFAIMIIGAFRTEFSAHRARRLYRYYESCLT